MITADRLDIYIDCVCVHVCMCVVHVYRCEVDLVCLPPLLATIPTEALSLLGPHVGANTHIAFRCVLGI